MVLFGISLTGSAMLIAQARGASLDMRPLLLLEIIPVLVIPAGALGLPGRATGVLDWIIVLTLYALAKLLETGDEFILEASGWISGHTLMHLALSAAVGWMAYCAVLARTATGSAGEASGVATHRDTSLNTVA